MIPIQPKHIALAPIYLYQGLKLKRTALRLPEADGERQGQLALHSVESGNTPTNPLNIMLVGDSSAAGVGVSQQQEALSGHLLSQLQAAPYIQQNFNQINWSLHATSGHTSFEALRRLYILPTPDDSLDVMIVLIGVNDTTSNTPPERWQSQLRDIINLAQRKFGAKHIIFPCLPPMQNMPAIPKPLNQLLGAKTALMNEKLIEVCEDYDTVIALPIRFENTGLKSDELFAEDGFHPNSVAYSFLAKKLVKTLISIV